MLGERNGSFLEKEMFDLKTNSNNKKKQEEEHSSLWKGIILQTPQNIEKTYSFREVEQQSGKKMAGNKVGEESGATSFSQFTNTYLEHYYVSDTEIQGLRYNPHS